MICYFVVIGLQWLGCLRFVTLSWEAFFQYPFFYILVFCMSVCSFVFVSVEKDSYSVRFLYAFFFVCLVLQFRSTLTVLYLFLRLLLAFVFFYLVNFMLFRVPEWSFGAIREPTSVLRSLFASFLLSLFSFSLLGLLCFFSFHLHFTFPLPSSCRALIPEIKQWQEQWN